MMLLVCFFRAVPERFKASCKSVHHTWAYVVRLSIKFRCTHTHTHTQALRGIVVGEGMEVEEAVQLVAKEKEINVRTHPRYAGCRDSGKEVVLTLQQMCIPSTFKKYFEYLLPSALSFVSHLTPSLVRICGVRCLLGEVEALRAQPYSQEDEEHERMLLEVGEHLPPFCGDRHAVSIGEDYNTLSIHCLVPFSCGLSWCQTFVWNPESPSSGRTLVSKATTLLQTSGGWECSG